MAMAVLAVDQIRTTETFVFQETGSTVGAAGGASGGDIASNVIDTSTNSGATSASFQRKLFYDTVNAKWWSFYNNGTLIEFSNSADGQTWISRGTTGGTLSDFSVWYVNGTSTVYLTYTDSLSVLAQKGTLSATAISWTAATTVADASAGGQTDRVNISRDSNGKLWVFYLDSQINAPCTPPPGGIQSIYNFLAQRSTNVDDTSLWDAAVTIDTLTTTCCTAC